MERFKRFLAKLLIFLFVIPISNLNVTFVKAQDVSPVAPGFRTINLPKNSNSNIEIENLRTRFSNTYFTPDGKKEIVISSSPLHYKTKVNGQDTWEDINTELYEKPAISGLGIKEYSNKANDFSLNISNDLVTKGIKLTKDNSSIQLTAPDITGMKISSASPLSALSGDSIGSGRANTSVDKDKLKYSAVTKNIDLEYQSISNGVKESIIVNKYSDQNVFSFKLNLENVYPEKLPTGGYTFKESTSKKAVFLMPQSYMIDSSKEPDYPEGALSYDVNTDLIKIASGYEVRLTASKKWLSDPKRVYPVIIDPTIVTDLDYGEDSFVQQGYPNTNSANQAQLYVGRTSYYGKGITRTYIPFFLPDLKNARISNARFSAFQYICNGICPSSGVNVRLTGDYDPNTITWNNQPWVSSDWVGHTSDGGVDKWIDIDVSNAAKYWFEAGNPGGTKIGSLAFFADNESVNGQRNWKAENGNPGLSPTLTIDYNDYDASYGIDRPTGDIRVDDLINLTARVRNDGRNWWRVSDTKLSYHIYDSNGNCVVWDGIYNNLPRDIAPGGDMAEFSAQIKMPSKPGAYTVKWDLIQPGNTWFSSQGIPTFDYSITVNDYPEYEAQYYVVSVPESVVAGSTIHISLTLYNTSRTAWTTDKFFASSHWFDVSTGEYIIWDGSPNTLLKEVPARNGSITLDFQTRVPTNAGNYKLKIDMLRKDVGYFSEKGVATKDYNIQATPPNASSLNHLGSEEFYVKAGPVDLATGNLSFSSTDMSISSNSGLLSFERSYNSVSLDQQYSQDLKGYVNTWLLNGPYRNNDLGALLSNNYIQNESTIRPNTLAVSNNKIWTKATSLSNIINLRQMLESNWMVQSRYAVNSVVYAHTYVYSPTTISTKLRIGSNDGVKVWLNGTVVDNVNSFRTFKLDNDVVNANLVTGWNSLLIKVSQKDSDWLMSARFTDLSGNPVTSLKYSLDNQEIYGDYNSMGRGWSSTISEKLYLKDPNNIYYKYLDGSVNLFTKKSDGTYNRPSGIFLNLIKNADGTFSIINKAGLKTNFNSKGQLVNKTDLSGNSVIYQYDTSGRCVKISDTNRYLVLAYSGNQLVSVTDQLGNKYSYSYNSTAYPYKLISVTDPAVAIHTYSYDTNHRLSQFNDRNGSANKIVYDSTGKIASLTNALNATYKFSYSNGKTEMTDPLGRTNVAELDGNNLVTAYTNAKKYREIIAYDGDYNIVSITPDLKENDYYYYRYAYKYDSNSNLVEISDPLDRKTTFLFSGNDLARQTMPDGTYYQYFQSTDGRRLLTKQIDPKGNIYEYIYDSRGRVISAKDPEGNITKYSYSSDGDIITVTTPKGEISSFTYDSIGRKITDKTSLGKILTYSYSKVSLLTKIIDPIGQITTYGYDKNRNRIKETYPNSKSKQYAYDAIGQLIKVVDEVGLATQYFYDAVGNKIKVIDANGKITLYAYDELDQLISETDSSGAKTTAQYDRNGEIVKVTDPKGQVSASVYDKIGNLTKATDTEGTTNFSYDLRGNISKIVSSKNAETTQATYDKNNNITKLVSNLTGTTTATYNKNNLLLTSTTATGTTSRSYDGNGVIASLTSQVNGFSLTTKFSRDAEGKTTNITKPNGDSAFYSYDSLNRVASVSNKDKNGQIVSGYNYRYDTGLNVTSVQNVKTGINDNYTYDSRNQLLSENGKTYIYDSMGNRKSITSGVQNTNYEYSATGDTNRLTKVNYPAVMPGVVPSQLPGQMPGSGGQPAKSVSYEYDASGNVIKQIDSLLGTTIYAYDSDGYFVKATLPSGSTIEYEYSESQKLRTKRIEKSPTGEIKTSLFAYDGVNLVSETIGGTNQKFTYIRDDYDNPIAVIMKNTFGVEMVLDYVKNAKGDIIGLADPSGNLVIEYQYDAWGNVIKTVKSPNVTLSDPANLNRLQYSGYWYDSSLGLYFLKARMYDSKIGRFLAKDPSPRNSTSLDYNPYIYCNNNPLVYIDTDGRMAEVASLGIGLIGLGEASTLTGVGLALGIVLIAAGVGVIVWELAQDRSIDRTDTRTSDRTTEISPAGPSLPNNNKDKNKNTKPKKYYESPIGGKPGRDPVKYRNLEISSDRWQHIESRHVLNSENVNFSGSKFPKNWTNKDISAAIEDIANRNTNVLTQPNTKGVSGIHKIGDYNGIKIKVIIKNAKKIWTAFPIK